MSWKITRQDYLDFFRRADTNRDGYISTKELRSALKDNGYRGTDSDINVMFHTTDTDGDNLISLTEFYLAMGQQASLKHVCEVFVRVFRRNDDNRDGVVTQKEFNKAMQELEPYLTKDEFTRLDDMIPAKHRKDFNYLQFKAQIQGAWEMMEHYDLMWLQADDDRDGLVTRQQLNTVLRDHGYAQKDIDKKFKEMKSKNGKISYDEYIKVMGEMPNSSHKAAFLRKSFEKFDTDGSGTISKKELKAALNDLGRAFSDRQIKQIMDKADTDGSGELEYDEFVQSIEEILAEEDAYEKFFREADVDDSGFLTLDELITALKKGGYKGADDQIKRMFNATDYSGDREISFDEYMQCMGRNPPANYRAAYMRQIFNDLDDNGDGKIDKKELTKAFKQMGKVMSPKEIKRIMELADKDNSGTLEYEEFIQVCFGK